MIRLESVTKCYPANGTGFKNKQITVLDKVSLHIGPAQIFGLIGSSGSGKSTLGKLILGLEGPDAGEIYFNDKPVSGLLANQGNWFRNQCQAIFQDPKASLSPKVKIGELLLESLRLVNDTHESGYAATIAGWLDKVNLNSDILDRYPRQLSGGEAQRVCIIRALMRKPLFLICDEPTSSLDVATEWDIINLIKSLQSQLDLTVLFMTHNLYLLPALADMIGILHQGHLIETGTVNQVFHQPAQEFTKLLVKNSLVKRAI